MTSEAGQRPAPAAPGGTTSPDMEALKAEARAHYWNRGISLSPNKIARLCLTFKRRVEGTGISFSDFLANSVQLEAATGRRSIGRRARRRAIAYADPTGEDAIRNVMRGM